MYGRTARRAELMRLLERVGLEHAAVERAQTFSRGMAQRLNLARVYMVEPELLFLDEPGTGLDPASLAALRADIRALAASGAAVAWVSHHVAEDAALADNALLLADRKAAYSGLAKGLPGEATAC
jgi:heme exporter protein A